VWTVSWTAGAVIADVSLFTTSGLMPTRLFAPVPLISLVVIIFLLALLAASMERHLRGIAARSGELERVEKEIATIYAGVQEELAAEKRRVALLLHGPVQGRLAAVAMLLKLDGAYAHGGVASVATRDRCREILAHVAVDLAAVVDGTVDDGQALPDRLSHLTERWRGIASVSLISDPRVVDVAALDLGLSTWIYEIVEEGINNAVTHGHATQIDVQMRLQEGLIVVSVRDNGVGGCAGSKMGLGLSTIGRSPARLTLSAHPRGGCHLIVMIPSSPGGQILAPPVDMAKE
jgi:signal transduction histidine kinase